MSTTWVIPRVAHINRMQKAFHIVFSNGKIIQIIWKHISKTNFNKVSFRTLHYLLSVPDSSKTLCRVIDNWLDCVSEVPFSALTEHISEGINGTSKTQFKIGNQSAKWFWIVLNIQYVGPIGKNVEKLWNFWLIWVNACKTVNSNNSIQTVKCFSRPRIWWKGPKTHCKLYGNVANFDRNEEIFVEYILSWSLNATVVLWREQKPIHSVSFC